MRKCTGLVRVVHDGAYLVEPRHAQDDVWALQVEHPELEVSLVLTIHVDSDRFRDMGDGHGGSGR
eukprot:2871352-Rhodomonas_salina.1